MIENKLHGGYSKDMDGYAKSIIPIIEANYEKCTETEQHIAEAGNLMGISLMDYLICSNKEYFSFGEKDMLSAEEKSA